MGEECQSPEIDRNADEEDDMLRCTSCGAVTDVTMKSLFDSMGKTKRGTLRRGRAWLKNIAKLAESWLCNDCLEKEEAKEKS